MNRTIMTMNAVLQLDVFRIRSGIIKPLPKLFYELRYNENHDEKGRFTFGSSGSGSSKKTVDKAKKSGIINSSLKISMQYFGSKYFGLRLSKTEYGKVKGEINTYYYQKYANKTVFVHRTIYNNKYYDYTVCNYGFDNYVFMSKVGSK